MRRACFVVAALLIGAAVVPCFAAGDQNGPAQAPEDQAVKAGIVQQIMTAGELKSGRRWDPAARENLKQVLMGKPLEELSSAAAEGDQALHALFAKTLGSATSDWVFNAVTPCRILDTRPGSGAQGAGTGPYLAGTVHSFDVAGGTSGCTIPFPTAKAAVLNFIALAASGNGNMRAWPFDTTMPAAPPTGVLNFTTGFNTSNSQVQPICNTATATGGNCSDDLFVELFINSAHVAIDTVGYFSAPPTNGLIGAAAHITGGVAPTVDRSFNNLSASAITVLHLGTGTYEVDFGTNIASRFYVGTCGNAASGTSIGEVDITPRATNPNALFVTTENPAGTAVDTLSFFLAVY